MRNSDPNLDLFSSSKRNPMPDEFEDISSASYPGAEFRPPTRDIPVWHAPLQSPGKKGKKKKTHRLRNAVIILLCLITVLSGSLYWYAYQAIDKIKRVPLDTNDLGITSDNYKSVKNIALFGVDARKDVLKGRSDAILWPGEVSGAPAHRTDITTRSRQNENAPSRLTQLPPPAAQPHSPQARSAEQQQQQ